MQPHERGPTGRPARHPGRGDGRPPGARAGADGHLEPFLVAMSGLGEKFGPLVLQFPYFNRQVFAGAGPFLARLDAFLAKLPTSFRYAVEIRNKKWFNDTFLDLLRSHQVPSVLLDLNYMPHPASYLPGLDLVTTDFAYGPLIGDRPAVGERIENLARCVVRCRSAGLRCGWSGACVTASL
ncbi:MAG: DUF72 domain-containing protein [Acidobacteriota bacterium]